MPKGDLEIRVTGNSEGFSRSMRRSEAAAERFSKRLGRGLGRTLVRTSQAAAVLGTAMGVAAVKGAVELEAGLSEVRSLLPDLTDKGFKQLRTEVLGLSTDMGIATKDVIPGLYQAISAGVPRDNVLEFMTIASKGAIGGVTDLETSVDALTTVLNTWGKSAGVTAQQASDVLFTAVKLGKTTMDELGRSINLVASLAASFGIGFEDVAAAVTEVTKAGVPTARAMTQIRALMQALTAPTARTKKMMKEYGIQTNAARLANEGLLPTLNEIMEATQGDALAMREFFGSIEAIQSTLVLTKGGGEDFIATLGAMKAAVGATDQAFNTLDTSVARQYERVKIQLSNEMTKLGVKVLPTLVVALGHVSSSVSYLADRTSVLGEVWERVTQYVRAFWGVVAPPLNTALDLLTDTVSKVAAVLSDKLLAALGALRPAMVRVAAVVKDALLTSWERSRSALVDLADLISTHTMPTIKALGVQWERTVGSFVAGAVRTSASGESMGDRLRAVWAAIPGAAVVASSGVSSAWSAATSVVGAQSAGMIAYWREHVWPALSGLRDFFGIVMKALGAAFVAAVAGMQLLWAVFGDSLLAVMSRVWDLIGSVVRTALELIRNIITVALDAISLVFGGFADIFYGRWDKLWGRVRTLSESVWELITDLFSGMLGVLLDLSQVYGEGVEQVFRLLWRAVTSVTRAGLDSVISILTAGRDRITAVFDQILAPIQALISAAQTAANAVSSIPSLPSLPGIPGGGLLGGITSRIPGFARGGMVGGPIGAPQLAVVHGGERILTPAQQRGGQTLTLDMTIRVEGGVISEGDLSGYLVDAINRALRRGDVTLPRP